MAIKRISESELTNKIDNINDIFTLNMMKRLDGYIASNNDEYLKINNLIDIKSNGKKVNFYEPYENGKLNIKICPEPATIYDYLKSAKNPKEKFNELKEKWEEIEVSKPDKSLWINRTMNGINLRLGDAREDSNRQDPIVLGDLNVHGVIVGRTGAGKSNLLNTIILNLISEYAPWELDLYLVDMKKVELSRYMTIDRNTNNYKTPHVVALGATSEVRYVVSLISKIEECMQRRQDLFKLLGDVKKIQDFREKYGVCLPRILVLIDEFQQLFSSNNATNKEISIIQNKISSITKLGRATGVHMLLASQEMGGALTGRDLANFKVRIALPCDTGVSTDILGNNAAAELKIGQTLVNTKGGSSSPNDNVLYSTPFIDDSARTDEEGNEKESILDEYLSLIHDEASKIKWTKNQTAYSEDNYPDASKLLKILDNKSVRSKINDAKKQKSDLTDFVALGSPVLFNLKKNDFSSFFIEKGRKRNFAVVALNDSVIGGLLKVLNTNLIKSDNKYFNRIILESESIKSVYNFIDDFNCSDVPYEEKTIDEFSTIFNMQKSIYEILAGISYSSNSFDSFRAFLSEYMLSFSDEFYKSIWIGKDENFSIKKFTAYLEKSIKSFNGSIETFDELIDNYVTSLKNQINEYRNQLTNSQDPALNKELIEESNYLRCITICANKVNSNSPNCIFKNQFISNIYNDSVKSKKYVNNYYIINWVVGTDSIDKLYDKALSKRMENSTKFNEYFVLVGNSIETLDSSYRNCNYIFMSTNDEKMYNSLKVSYSMRSEENRSVDFKIVNYNKQFTFKPFIFEDLGKYDLPNVSFESVDFDK